MKNMFCLTTSVNFSTGQAFVICTVHTHQSGGIDAPFVRLGHAEQAKADAIQVPIALFTGFAYTPMERTVVNTVLPVKVMQVGLNICFHSSFICIADVEKHGRRLGDSQLFVTHFIRHSAAEGHIAIAGAVNHYRAAYQIKPPLGGHDHAGQRVLFQHRLQESRVIQDMNAGFLQHFIDYQLESFRLIGGNMLMAQYNPRGKAGTGMHFGRMNGISAFHHPIDNFFKQAANDHGFAFAVITGHKRTYHALCCHTAAGTALLHQHHTNAFACGSDGCTHTSRTTANHDNIGGYFFAYRSKVKLVHVSFLHWCCKTLRRFIGFEHCCGAPDRAAA